MSESIPILHSQEKYEAWINQLADKEIDVIKEEIGRVQAGEGHTCEISYDDMWESVEHSGHVQFPNGELVDKYHDVWSYTHSTKSGTSVTPGEDDLLRAAANITGTWIKDDVRRVVREKLGEDDEVSIV